MLIFDHVARTTNLVFPCQQQIYAAYNTRERTVTSFDRIVTTVHIKLFCSTTPWGFCR